MKKREPKNVMIAFWSPESMAAAIDAAAAREALDRANFVRRAVAIALIQAGKSASAV